MTVLLFEDSVGPRLSPITTARPAFCVTAGSYHLLDLVRQLGQPLVASVRKHLQPLCTLDCSPLRIVGEDVPNDLADPQILLNARLLPSISTLETIRALLGKPDARGAVWHGDQLAAVVRPEWTWDSLTGSGLNQRLSEATSLQRIEAPLRLLSFPHDVIAANMEIIRTNLEHRIATGEYQQLNDGVFVARGAKLGEFVLTETHDGPIVIDQDAYVGPYTLLRGPIYIGSRCKVLEHAAIKDAVSLAHTTKIGGEVEASVVEPFSNKQHHGFLGHSYLGSWINLGAGTCNSDLKNTYGTVNMEYPAGKAATGMQFLGCVMGDYSKTAINTGIFTGKVIGVCSMMYGFVTSNVPSFVNYARLFGQISTLPPEIMIATQQRMFSRRKVEQRPCDMQLLHDMYRITQFERDKIGDDLAF